MTTQPPTPERPKWFVPEHPSTTLHKLRYWVETETLDISFKGNGTQFYRYGGVPGDVHEQLSRAENPGAFFMEKVRGKFEFKKVAFADEPRVEQIR